MHSRTLTCIALLTALLSGCNEQHSSKRLNCNATPQGLRKQISKRLEMLAR